MLRTLSHPAALTGLAAVFLTLLMAVFPNEALESALRGLSIWWQVLFPALFPFFVISELLLGFGIVHFFGKLLDPLMRPLFKLPGIGSFVVAMGYISGYPVGARLTAKLYEQQLINRTEGERLVAFTTTSDPIFLIGAVSVGFFHNVALAPVLAAAHYGGALIIGLLMRFHDPHAPITEARRSSGMSDSGAKPVSARHQPLHTTTSSKHSQHSQHSLHLRTLRRSRLADALKAMHEARLLDGRGLGQLLQEAIQSALRLMIVVGGLVVFFSVIMEMLTSAGLITMLAAMLRQLFELFGLPPALADAAIFGLFEVTLGARAAGEAGTGLLHQTAIAAWVLSWGGLSVHAQVASLVSKTDMRYKPLMLARLLHGFIALGLVYALWGWLGP
ncbi:sporulation integral membrane protein YlbJ [Paenibacillus sp. BIHB 4019]|uniref:Sporulation integral membrane protein YlbJ n=1 Tax=Paenibacillus sp. BIHB 4019 TaxID=1870819 RepID=A0A1B2DJJ7_9BACL|nr:sporulation integral membrane protein YlbJ [Paenibacillus sp. BIHB 4019]ANY67897.1 sporulation integral membrane protein YlbJ [Paenibacillus sp. BIHB 4019]